MMILLCKYLEVLAPCGTLAKLCTEFAQSHAMISRRIFAIIVMCLDLLLFNITLMQLPQLARLTSWRVLGPTACSISLMWRWRTLIFQ